MASRRRAAKEQCPICSQMFSAQGISAHLTSCQRKHQGRDKFQELAGTLQSEETNRHASLLSAVSQPIPVSGPSRTPLDIEDPIPQTPQEPRSQSPVLPPPLLEDVEQTFPDEPRQDTIPRRSLLDILDNLPPISPSFSNSNTNSDQIRIDYHPTSKKPSKTFPTKDYAPHRTKASGALPTDSRPPWEPFRTRLDFEIAELALSTHMNKRQVTTLFSLLERCGKNPTEFTMSSAAELETIWSAARDCRASGFIRKEYVVPYKGNDVEYTVFVRPLKDWCNELLSDPLLFPKFRWNAERHFKFNGTKSERLIGEPWTADTWWKIQNRLPKGARPFCIILYADKTRLSTFGTAKAYPVLARCANLPSDIRNGDDVGGGRLVGWLPIVEETAEDTGKKVFVNLKRVVWHKGFQEIMWSILEYKTTGYHTSCAESDVLLWLFFFIIILSADYEEQCVMALTRGSTSNFPCPVCLVPREELWDVSKSYPLRTSSEMSNILKEARDMNAKDREEYLKSVGLRDIENVFWMMNGTDIYGALSWDRLHAYHGGLFSNHLWSEFKLVVDSMSRSDAKMIDNQFNLIPRWSGLNHFSSILKTGEFADGSKHEDMGKIIVFASHNVLSHENTERGYCLLRLMRSFLELDMYSSLTIHSDTTLDGLAAELLEFGRILEIYMELYPDKNWNFPKNHSHIHMIRDILEKGVTRNSNTKPNEKAHGLLKLWYRFRTNFKDVAPQILKLNEQDLIAMIIRMAIDFADEMELMDLAEKEEISELMPGNCQPSDGPLVQPTVQVDVTLGSPLPSISLLKFRAEKEPDSAFSRFHIKLGTYLATQLNRHIRLGGDVEITPYQLARIRFQSVVDWSWQRDLVRVSSNFRGQPRNDYILAKTEDGKYFFAQLLAMFTVMLEGSKHELAHVLPLDGSIDKRTTLFRRRDRDLRFTRVQARRKSQSVIISVQSLVRGGLLVSDFGNDGNDFIVIDVVDPDMWWRLKQTTLSTNIKL